MAVGLANKLGPKGLLAVRIALLVCACVFVVSGILLLVASNSQQAASNQAVGQNIKTVSSSDAKADVLLLLSYDESDDATALGRAGVLDVMGRSAVAVDVEYMDALNAPAGSVAQNAWSQMLAAKIAQHGAYNCVICSDDEALTFAEANHDSLFPGAPVVFYGVNDFNHATRATLSGYEAGIVEQTNLGQTMQLAAQLVPNASSFLVVTDETPSGVGNLAQFKAAMALLPSMSAQYLNASSISRSQLYEQLAAAPKDCIVFLLDAANDAQGNAYSVNDSARLVSQASPRPVFRASSGGVGEGLVGSGYVDYAGDGQKASEYAIAIMNGEAPSSLELVTTGATGAVLDKTAMDAYGISAGKLPAEVTLVTRGGEPTGSAMSLVWPILLLILGFACILLYALIHFYRASLAAQSNREMRQSYEERLYKDDLTDMPNMEWLSVNSALGQDAEVNSIAQVVIEDVDAIVDAFGQDTADDVIKQLASRLGDLDKTFLVRSNVDSFIIGFPHALEKGSDELGELESLVRRPYMVGDDGIDTETCLAVVNRSEGMNVADMVAGAVLALKQAKSMGGGRETVFYELDMQRAREDMKEITAELKKAIADDGFVIYYQPQVDVETNDVTGYEALVRFKNDAYPPTQFIPVAEMTGLVTDLGRIVTQKAIQQLATWKKRNKRLRPISINYSPVQLKDEGYVDYLLGLLEEYDVPPSLIKIEITENLFKGDAERADELLERLGESGISVALDDFGIGYTSISRILSIPAEVIKVDKSLVDMYMTSEKGDTIGNLAKLVHGLGKKVYVEGVETGEQMEMCRKLGFDMVQGFYFSKPLLPERAAQFKPAR